MKAAAERFRTPGLRRHLARRSGEATGLARPSLYAAFGDKRALYLATLERLHRGLNRPSTGWSRATAPAHLLETIFASTIDGYLTGELGPSGCLAVGTATAEAAADPEIRAALLAIMTLQDDRMARCSKRRRHRATARRGARIVMSVLHSLSVRARAGMPRAELEAIAQDAIR